MGGSYALFIVPTCSVLCVLSSILCLAFKATSRHLHNASQAEGTWGVFLRAEFPDQFIELALYPSRLDSSASTVEIIAASIALAVAVLVTIFAGNTMRKRRPAELKRNQVQIFLGVVASNALFAFAAFVTAFVVHGKSAHFSLDYRDPQSNYSPYTNDSSSFGLGGQYNGGVFDLETWACEVRHVVEFQDFPEFRRECTLEAAGRFCSVPLFIFATAMFLVVWWDFRENNLLLVQRKVIRIAWGDEPDSDCELEDAAIPILKSPPKTLPKTQVIVR